MLDLFDIGALSAFRALSLCFRLLGLALFWLTYMMGKKSISYMTIQQEFNHAKALKFLTGLPKATSDEPLGSPLVYASMGCFAHFNLF